MFTDIPTLVFFARRFTWINPLFRIVLGFRRLVINRSVVCIAVEQHQTLPQSCHSFLVICKQTGHQFYGCFLKPEYSVITETNQLYAFGHHDLASFNQPTPDREFFYYWCSELNWASLVLVQRNSVNNLSPSSCRKTDSSQFTMLIGGISVAFLFKRRETQKCRNLLTLIFFKIIVH